MQSFLGLICYLRDYIQNFADKTEKLREICLEEKPVWKSEHQQAFDDIKKEIINCTVKQGFYDVEDKTILYTDASPYGLGAVLVQINKKNQARIISFASRSSFKVERTYAQTQREALAVVWAV